MILVKKTTLSRFALQSKIQWNIAKDLIDKSPLATPENNLAKVYGGLLPYLLRDSHDDEIAEKFINKGAELEWAFNDSYTPLLLAIKNNRPTLIESLLKKNAIISNIGDKKLNAIDIAIQSKNSEAVKLILQYRTLESVDYNKLLHFALENNQIELVYSLLSKGADPNYRNNRNETATIVAEKNTHFAAIINAKRKFKGNFYLKSARADQFNYFRRLTLNLTRTSAQKVKGEYRIVPKRRYGIKKTENKLTGNILDKCIYPQDKIPKLYDKKDIPFHSSPQAVTLVSPGNNLILYVFGTGKPGQGGGQRDKLLGLIFDDCADTPVYPEYVSHSDFDSSNRPYQFNILRNALSSHADSIDFALAHFFSTPEKMAAWTKTRTEEKYKKFHNETLARLKWDIKTGCIFIADDLLETRLLAMDYARVLLARLKASAAEENKSWDENTSIPIYYYMPDNPSKHLMPYHIFEQHADKCEANRIAMNDTISQQKFKDNHFEFLLGLSPEIIYQKLTDNKSSPHLLMRILESGYVHIAQSLIEIAKTHTDKLLDDIQSKSHPNLTPSAKALYHAARVGDEQLVNWMLSLSWPWASPYITNEHSALAIASKNGHASIVKKLLDSSILSTINHETKVDKIYKAAKHPKTPLMYAAKRGRNDIVEILMQHGADVNACNSTKKNTALMYAAHGDRIETVKLLLGNNTSKNNLKINVQNSRKETALHIAAKKGHLDIVKLLLNDDRTLQCIQDSAANFPLDYAVDNYDIEMIEVIMKSKSFNSNNAKKINLLCAQLLIAQKESDADKTTQLTKLRETIQKLTKSADNQIEFLSKVFSLACEHNNLTLAKLLLEDKDKHLFINCQSSFGNGYTPIIFASIYGYHKLLQVLIDNGADLNSQDKLNNTAVHHSACYDITSFKHLIVNGINTQLKNNSNFACINYLKNAPIEYKNLIDLVNKLNSNTIDQLLYNAINTQNIADIRALFLNLPESTPDPHASWDTLKDLFLNHGAPFNKACFGRALLIAAQNNNLEAVKKIVSLNPDFLQKDSNGYTIIRAAANKYNWDIVEYLLPYLPSAKSDESLIGEFGSALHMATFAKRYDIAIKIIVKGPATDWSYTNTNDTPLLLAIKDPTSQSALQLVEKILEAKADIINIRNVGIKAVDIAITSKNTQALLLILKHRGTELDQKAYADILFYAIENNCSELVEKLIELKADLTQKLKDDKIALRIAVEKNQWTIVEKLLPHQPSAKQDEFLFNEHGSALHLTTFVKRYDIAIQLLSKGAATDWAYTDTDHTPLLLAIKDTPNEKNLEFIKQLLLSKADISNIRYKNIAAIDFAIEAKNLEAIKLILQYHKLNSDDYSKLLHFAIENNHIELAYSFLEAGADPNYKNKSNQTAIDIAKNNPHFAKLINAKREFKGNYHLKGARADTLNFFRTLVLNVTRTSKQRVKGELRNVPKKRYCIKVTENLHEGNIFDKCIYPKDKIPKLYDESKIPHHSAPQAVTLVSPNKLTPHVFGTGLPDQPGGKREKLLGLIFDDSSDIPVCPEIVSHGDFNSTNRSWYQFNILRAAINSYVTYVDNSCGHFFSSSDALATWAKDRTEIQYKKFHNETLARLKWDIKTSAIFIADDLLETRLLAMEYARILLARLKAAAAEENEPWNENTTIPIYYYMPDNASKHLMPYHILSQQADKCEAQIIANNNSQSDQKYKENNFEFLLALSPEVIYQKLTSNPQLLIRILESGYVHIAQSLLEISKTYKDNILDEIKKASPNAQALYHAGRAGDEQLVSWLLKLNWTTPLITNDHSALAIASKNGHAGVVKKLLEIKDIRTSINTETKIKYWHKTAKHFKTPLMYAAKRGRNEVVKILIENGADVNACNSTKKNTALMYAAHSDRVDTVKLLLDLDKGKNNLRVNAQNAKKETALHIAVKKGHLELATLLLNESNAHQEFKDAEGNAPLDNAVENYDIEMIEVLMKSKSFNANIVKKNNLYCAQLLLAQKESEADKTTQLTKLLETLEKLKNSADNKIEFLSKVFLLACEHNNLTLAKLLLEEKDKHLFINCPSNFGNCYTPIIFASIYGYNELLQVLIDNGANLHSEDKNGYLALHHAASYQQSSSKILIANGANTQLKYKLTAPLTSYLNNYPKENKGLIDLVNKLNSNTVDQLLYNAINTQNIVDIRTLFLNIPESTPDVHISWDTLKDLFLSHGAPFSKACFGRALLIAVQNKNLEAIKKILSLNPQLDQKTCADILLYAIENNCSELVEKLLELKVDLSQKIKDDKIALRIAIEKNQWTVVEALLPHQPLAKSGEHHFNEYGASLHLTTFAKRYDIAIQILSKGAATEWACPDTGFTALLLAIKDTPNEQNLELIKQLLIAKVSIVNIFNKGYAALDFAKQHNNWDAIILILENRLSEFEPNAITDLIFEAINKNKETHLKKLLELESKVYTERPHLGQQCYGPAITHAIKTKNQKAVEILSWHGAKFDLLDKDKKSALDYAKESNEISKFVSIALSNNNTTLAQSLPAKMDINFKDPSIIETIRRALDFAFDRLNKDKFESRYKEGTSGFSVFDKNKLGALKQFYKIAKETDEKLLFESPELFYTAVICSENEEKKDTPRAWELFNKLFNEKFDKKNGQSKNYEEFCHKLLILACHYNDPLIFDRVLGTCVPSLDPKNHSPKIEDIINFSNDINLLSIAVENDHWLIGEKLLKFGAKTKSPDGKAILVSALEKQNYKMAENLTNNPEILKDDGDIQSALTFIKTGLNVPSTISNRLDEVSSFRRNKKLQCLFVQELSKYCKERLSKVKVKKPGDDPKSVWQDDYYTFFAREFTGHSAKAKIQAAEKLMRAVKQKNELERFSKFEIDVLSKGHLGDVIRKFNPDILPIALRCVFETDKHKNKIINHNTEVRLS